MNRFNSYTWLLKCLFATFHLKTQNTEPYPQLNKKLLPLFLSIFQTQLPNTSKMKHYYFDTTLLMKGESGECCGEKKNYKFHFHQSGLVNSQDSTKPHRPWTNDPILSIPWFAYVKMAPFHSGTLRTITWQKSGAGRTRLAFSRDKRVVYICAAIIILAKGLFSRK